MGLFDFFKKRPTLRSLAEVRENGREAGQREMTRPKYRDYQGAEPMVDVAVRVEPQGAAPYDAVMKAGFLKTYLLLPGVRVYVTHTEGATKVTLDDTDADITERNAAILKR